MTPRITAVFLGIFALTMLVWQPGRADAFGGHRRAVTAYALPSVPVAVPVTAAYAPMTPVIVGRPVVVASPIVAAPVVSAPVVANYAPLPAAPVTTFYAPTTNFVAPARALSPLPVAPATTSFYAPATTSFYAPATTSFAPVTTIPAAGVAAPVIVQRPTYFVP